MNPRLMTKHSDPGRIIYSKALKIDARRREEKVFDALTFEGTWTHKKDRKPVEYTSELRKELRKATKKFDSRNVPYHPASAGAKLIRAFCKETPE